ENMEPRWRTVLVLLVFYQSSASTSGDPRQLGPLKEKANVDIECQPPGAGTAGTLTTWFRVLNKPERMEFIAAFSNYVRKTAESGPSSSFNYTKIRSHKVTLNSFRSEHDSGLYACAALVKGRELNFGPLTRLIGEPVRQTPTVAPTTPSQRPVTSAPACTCPRGDVGPSLFCTPLILGPLVAACGLLLLLLIVTTLYCNRIRTRRCPHHYKRKPRESEPRIIYPVTRNRLQ
uniref:Ig-like domain-containing protein n=1 Tax=Tetraodon nigroviridis TaxID=99883 RepID=H3BY08_TETNG